MSPLVTGSVALPPPTTGSPRTVVQRAASSASPSNSSLRTPAHEGGGSLSPGSSPGSISVSDQSLNSAVASVPETCETTNRPMSCTSAADGIAVGAPTWVQSVPLREQKTVNTLRALRTLSQFGCSPVPQPVATGSPVSLTWPLPCASCMNSVSPLPFSAKTM